MHYLFFKIQERSKNLEANNQMNNGPKSIVLDLDETFLSRVDNKDQHKILKRINAYKIDFASIHQISQAYRSSKESFFMHTLLHPGCLEFIAFCHAITDNHVSFFTASGYHDFQESLINDIFNLVSKNLNIDLPKPNVYTAEHCTIIGEYHCKDLKLVAEAYNINVEDTLLIDNLRDSALPGQEKQLLKIETAELYHYECFLEEEFRTINHLFYVAGLIHSASQNKEKSFFENLHHLLAVVSGNPEKEWNYYLVGREVLKKYNPNLDFFTNNKKIEDLISLDESASEEKIFSPSC